MLLKFMYHIFYAKPWCFQEYHSMAHVQDTRVVPYKWKKTMLLTRFKISMFTKYSLKYFGVNNGTPKYLKEYHGITLVN